MERANPGYLLSAICLLVLLSLPGPPVQAESPFQNQLENVTRLLADEDYDGAMDALMRLKELVRNKASLVASPPVACEVINTFGDYGPRPNDVYEPGDTILLYTEITNFFMPATEAGSYDLWIKEDIRLFNDNNFQIWGKDNFIDYHHSFRSPISDLFLQNKLTLPAEFPEGKFIIKMEISDLLSGKNVETRYVFFVEKNQIQAGKPQNEEQSAPGVDEEEVTR